MQVKSISTHTNGKNQCFLLSEGAAFNIISDKYHTGKFTEKDGAEILKAVYGIKTAIIREKMKTNMSSSVKTAQPPLHCGVYFALPQAAAAEDVRRRVCHSQCGAVHRRNHFFALHQRSTVRHQPTCQGQ